jgi:type IV secretory pathway component VirB8
MEGAGTSYVKMKRKLKQIQICIDALKFSNKDCYTVRIKSAATKKFHETVHSLTAIAMRSK